MACPIETLFKEVDEKFNITQKQREAITILFDGEDVLVWTKTVSDKSMTYACAPVLFENDTTPILFR